jgi:Asp-tRNA(Asn)/Glu-tRNA(Gln) amidotransferase A subunit family amidase
MTRRGPAGTAPRASRHRLADALAGAGPAPGRLPGGAVDDPAAAVAGAVAAAGRPAGAGGAYIRLFAAAATAEADLQSACGDPRPLRGFSLAVKDIMTMAGSPLGAGSRQQDGAPAQERDAAVVAMLRGHGAIPVGLAALHEFAFGVTGVNDHAGTPRHPLDPGRVPGGSSSGCAVAVATGAAMAGVGTDTAGSVRIPAALCGVVGFKPGFGEYPAEGVFPLARSLDHVGLLATDVTTIRRMHALLTGDAGEVGPPRRVGVVDAQLAAADPAVRDHVRGALDRLADAGVEVGPCRWPGTDRSMAASTLILLPEAAAVHRAAFASAPGRFGADVRRLLEAAQRIDAPSYLAARQERRLLRAEVDRALREFDLVVGPTVPIVAPLQSDAREAGVSARLLEFTCLLNVVGRPALSLPLPAAGLPAGLQLVARDSASLLGAAAAIEASITRA